ncbi:porin [Sphingosinicella rhizophila]|uniref:Porin n=1 Tax=Sphingosinicella rhizophila TaxID=3050082 RepID=A0ABU3QCN4_9SPHN|nr:porin [Sphingosinicella sp. GR2756]MDT9600904.1 porin [Sphingosinicella sp. GR2756]
MKNNVLSLILLAGSSMIAISPAWGQTSEAEDVPVQEEAVTPEQVAARTAFLEAQVEALQEQLESIKKQISSSKPSWKGAPQFVDKESGWSFKPRGRLQYDAGFVSRPDGITDRGLGFSNEVRRARLGVEGNIPGGLGYKFEIDFAGNSVDITDAYLSYDFMPSTSLIIGQHNNFQSLEELTSSRFSSFIERAAFTDAFNFERRVGVSATYAHGPVIASAGVFTDSIGDLNDDDNNSLGFDGRLVFAPKLGETQLHFGGSAHYRKNRDLVDIGTTTRYRQRPLVHSSDTRFLATPALAVEKETNYGLEAAAIHGPFHAVGEVHWLKADRVDPAPTPTFFGGYAEVGYYITGETRGYKGGTFDRTKVLKSVKDGGMGALQVNLRYDYLDLIDAGVVGGKQQGYQISLIWIPQDYVRFMLNYGRLDYKSAAIPAAGGDRNYGVDVIGARAQIDF